MQDALDDATRARLDVIAASTWPLPGGVRLTPLTVGANNLVLRVDGAEGRASILRIYRNHADSARVRHEVALLAALRERSLPFAVPTPIATRAGAQFAHLDLGVNGGLQDSALAVLWTYLPGTHPDRGDPTLAAAAGTALAQLDAALGTVDPTTLSGRPTPPLGDLRRRLALLEDPEDILRGLPLPEGGAEELARQWRMVDAQVPPLYDRLPRQLVHGDFDPSNVLVEHEHVSGILDFEFSGVDLRVADLAFALAWWPVHQLGSGDEWALLEALGRGYMAHLALLPDEVESLPALFRLRAIGGLLHRVARHRQGLMGMDQLLARAAFTIEQERWLQRNEGRLRAMTLSWYREA